jgi:hypothetical protein
MSNYRTTERFSIGANSEMVRMSQRSLSAQAGDRSGRLRTSDAEAAPNMDGK